MNYGKTDSLFTFKKVGQHGNIPHAFQFVGSIIVNQSIRKNNGYSIASFRKNGIMIYCDKNYKITAVCQRYQLYGGDKDNQGFEAYYISTNDSYTTAYIPTEDYQPATKKYVDGQTNSIISNIGTLTDLTTTNKDNLVNAINELSVDYIVEQGTSEIWSYRKWNSGFAECWTTTPVKFTFTETKGWGSVYESPLTYYNYPTNLFINDPNIIIQKAGGYGGWLEIGSGSTIQRTPGIYLIYPVKKTSSTTSYISIYASAKWK